MNVSKPQRIVIFQGWPVTANDDGSVPISSKIVEIETIVSDYQTLYAENEKLRAALQKIVRATDGSVHQVKAVHEGKSALKALS